MAQTAKLGMGALAAPTVPRYAVAYAGDKKKYAYIPQSVNVEWLEARLTLATEPQYPYRRFIDPSSQFQRRGDPF
jgi:hypothetical protein